MFSHLHVILQSKKIFDCLRATVICQNTSLRLNKEEACRPARHWRTICGNILPRWAYIQRSVVSKLTCLEAKPDNSVMNSVYVKHSVKYIQCSSVPIID